MRGDVSAIGGARSGSSRGATNQRNNIATPPTIATGKTHSNIENWCSGYKSFAIPTTSRFVEVPMVVDIPPTIVARPIGSMTPETGNLDRSEAPTSIGMSRTTIGVLFMNALSTAPATNVVNNASAGLVDQARPTIFASGWSAPVVSSALPTIINAQIATSASLPKPAKKSTGPSFVIPSCSYGNSANPATSTIRIASEDDSRGIRSRVKRNNATTVNIRTAIP